MPWILGGGVLLALLLSSKRATPVATYAPPQSAPSVRRATSAPAWRISHPGNLINWVNYFTGSSYPTTGLPVSEWPQLSNDYAKMVAIACAHASPSDIGLLTTLTNDLQQVTQLAPGHGGGPTGGIQGMTQAQAAGYRNQVLSCIARLSGGARGGGVVVRRPMNVPIGVTSHPSGGYVYSTQPGGGGGGGGGGGMPSIPSFPGGGGGGSGSGGGAEGTGIDPTTGLPSNVAPSVDNSAPIDTSGVGTTDSSGVTYGGELG